MSDEADQPLVPVWGWRMWLALIFGLLLRCTAGCGSGTGGAPGSAPRSSSAANSAARARVLPPRPANLPLTGVEPCALLVGPQVSQLGVGAGTPYGSTEEGDAECVWSTASADPADTWIARTLVSESAATALSDPHAQTVQVAGFPAVQTSDPTADPNHACELYIDVADGQSLLVAYVGGPNPSNGVPSTRPLACRKAAQAAELMIQTLKTLSH
ncbi:DUF3558 domain-containing protein [Pseudonocardia sp. Cha107L01]|uniref:DUF3558 domain-containing protein n=1 Tax=Pseudonocardia sp. Cha107L01 TaxID=3457576 RepID=UPI00403EB21C